MGESVNLLTNLLLASVRDQQGSYHSHALVLDLMSRCELMLNDALQWVLVTTPLLPLAYQTLYSLETWLPDTVSVVTVRDGERDLSKLTSLHDLMHMDRHWTHALADRHECWLQLGETYLILYPAVIRPRSINVISTQRTPAFASLPLDSTTIPQEHSHLLLTLTRAFLHLRARQYDQMAADILLLTEYIQGKQLTSV